MTEAIRATTTRPIFVLVLCTGTSARSQIAEALLHTQGTGGVTASSVGSHHAPRVNPHAVEMLLAHGIAWAGRTTQQIEAVEHAPHDLVITVCNNARDVCSISPGAVTVH